MNRLQQLWQHLFGGPNQRPLPPPDPDIAELHHRQHRIINDLQRHESDEWSRRYREAWHPHGGHEG